MVSHNKDSAGNTADRCWFLFITVRLTDVELRRESCLMEEILCLRVSLQQVQTFRKCLQARGLLDRSSCLLKEPSGTVLLPVVCSSESQLDLQSLRASVGSDSICDLVWTRSSRPRRNNGGACALERNLQELLDACGERWTEEVRRDVPRTFQRHGDLVLLGDQCFTLPLWKKMDHSLWTLVAKSLGAKRVARKSRISSDGFRSPAVTMLLGDHSWVKHVDNNISYEFDVTKSMFSAGNITEKLRVAGFDCTGETVVDLYAGIGYFTLPYLVHAGAAHVHACEWNPDAVTALLKNLEANRVKERCTIHRGDNRRVQLSDVADRVNLGLIPSSEDGWSVACRLLKRRTGGVLHIHQNISGPSPSVRSLAAGVSGKKSERAAWTLWADDAANRVASLLQEVTAASWRTSVLHVEHVKSYAPRVHHVVLDLDCRPSS